ncbi:hypothetical protein AB0O01_05820 [Streptomyces sp. NPDC093252]|uniref:hypothetical protein n=1 Tax=Streptomyces sp. NPDC093252 TaxID=3154980 RepID=UPI0034281423
MADDDSDHQAPGGRPRGAEGSWVRVVDLTFRLLMALRDLLRALRQRRRREPEERGDGVARGDRVERGDVVERGQEADRRDQDYRVRDDRVPDDRVRDDRVRDPRAPLPADPALRDAAVALDRARERIMAADAHQYRLAQARWERPAPATIPRPPHHPTAFTHPRPDLDPFAATVADRREQERREPTPRNGTETTRTPPPETPAPPPVPPKLPPEEPAPPQTPPPPTSPTSPGFVPLEVPPAEASAIGAEVTSALSPEAREFLKGTSLGSLGTAGGDSPAPRGTRSAPPPHTPRRPGRR